MREIILLILGAIIAYLLEFTRPWVKSYFEKRSLSIRERRLYVLFSHYKLVKLLRKHPAGVNLIVFRGVVFGLVDLIVLVLWVGLVVIDRTSPLFPTQIGKTPYHYYVHLGVLYVLAFMGIYIMNGTAKILDEIFNFDRYKEKVIAKIKKLGGNPEDLDKEETE